MYVYPTGNSSSTSAKTGDITQPPGQSPIGECVFKQMSPLVGAYKPTRTDHYITCSAGIKIKACHAVLSLIHTADADATLLSSCVASASAV